MQNRHVGHPVRRNANMSFKTWLQIVAFAVLAIFALAVLLAWRVERHELTRLQQQLKTAQDAVSAANAREAARNAALKKHVAQLRKQEDAVQTPDDALKALPGVLPLPKPLALDEIPLTGADKQSGQAKPASPAPQVTLPTEDLKPLYDMAVQCKECQAELATAQADLKDEKAKSGELSRERDDALRVAKGGSVLRRVARAAKWFAIGAAAGAAAVRLSR
jgi:cell division protein FtsB